MRQQFCHSSSLGRGVGVGQPQAAGADVPHGGASEHARDLGRGPAVVGDREHVGDASGEAVDTA